MCFFLFLTSSCYLNTLDHIAIKYLAMLVRKVQVKMPFLIYALLPAYSKHYVVCLWCDNEQDDNMRNINDNEFDILKKRRFINKREGNILEC